MEKVKVMKLNEYNGDKNQIISPEYTLYMDKLYDTIKNEILPIIPDKFSIDYKRGVSITLASPDKNDTKIDIKVDDEIEAFEMVEIVQ